MKLAVRFSSLFALFALLGALPAAATTYQMVQDPLLADQAQAIAGVRITQVESPAVDAKGNPVTDYVVEVERVLKGHLPGSSVVVRVPGGIAPNGIGQKIWGAPEFAPGEQALLFLNPAGDGTYRILHLMLGAFHRRTLAGRSIALRDLSEAHEVTGTGVEPGKDEPRDFERFAGWLADRAEGIVRARDYVLTGKMEGGLGQAVQPYTYITGDDDNPIRWFTFDEGRSVSWRVHSAGQRGLGLDATIAAFRTAIQAWNGDPGSNVRLSYAGLTEASAGTGRGDGTNAILFDDPNLQVEGSFTCPGGGVIAIGGPRFFRATTNWNGMQVHEAAEGDIVTNDGTDCFFSRRALSAEEVFAHELGHSLGLGHSQDTEALMYAFAHADGRGPRMTADDREAILSLYPSDGEEPPPAGGPGAPTGLGARLEGTSAVLTWDDRSTDETGFRVERKINSGRFREILRLPADTTTATVTGLQAGTTHTFRVRAVKGDGFSAYSNNASVTVPPTPPLAAPTGLLAVVHSSTELYLSWRETTQGETNFRIERSTNGGTFQEVGTAPANALGTLFTDLTPGTSYAFRVRAAGTAGFSAYSNTAALTMPASSPAKVCGENGPVLCLLGGRFRVEVDWRQDNGFTGKGILVRSSDKTATVWFFDPGNTELIIKMLDGRPINQQFWVFFSPLTNLELWVQITDTQTGLVRVYHNRAGDVRGMADTSAFPNAPLPAQPGPLPIREVRTLNPSPVAPVAETSPAQSPSTCVAGPNTLCLDNRFQVEVTWKNGSATGPGGVIPGLGSTGYFWFFDPENVELVVKVLDGTQLNDKFWVFYGSLSDVESWVKVTDTQTGKVKTYHNMPGSLANLADTSAF